MNMKDLRVRLKKLFTKYCPVISIFLLVGIFFWKVFLLNQVPIPGDFIVGVYFPWLDYKWGYVVGVPVKNPITTDVVSLIYPEQILGVKLMKAGQWPLWNPYILSGTPLFANLQVAPFSPTALVYSFLNYINGWSAQIILQHILAVLFTFILLRHWKISKWASLFAGIAYSFSGFNLIFSQWNGHTLSAAFLPLAILFCAKILKSGGFLNSVGLALVLTFQLFSGYPQVSLYTVLAIFVFWLVYIWGKPIKTYLSRTLLVGLAALMTILFSAVQLLPTAELWRLSQRGYEPIPYEWSFLPWSKIITFFAPDYFGNHATWNYWGPQDYTSNTGYVGIVVFAIAFLVLQIRKKNKEIYYLIILTLVSLIISFPTPISVFLWKNNILGMRSSSAHRATILFNFAIAMLSGFGFDFFLRKNKFKTIKMVFIPLTILLGFTLVALYHCLIAKVPTFVHQEIVSEITNYKVALRNLVLPFFFLSIILLVTYLKVKGLLSTKAASLILFMFMLFELYRFGWKFTPFAEKYLVYPGTPVITFLQSQPKPFRVTGNKVIPVNIRTPYALESLEGYETIHSLRISQFLAALNSDKSGTSPVGRYGTVDNDTSRLLDLTNTKYFLTIKTDINGDPDINGNIPARFKNDRFKIAFEDKTTVVMESNSYLPRAFMVYDWDIIGNDREILDNLLDANYPIDKKIILEEPTLVTKNLSTTRYQSRVVFESYNAENSAIRVNTPEGGFLFISDAYYPGWIAYVDGNKENILRADFAFRAVYVPKGEHTVTFLYKPASFFDGLKISLFSLLFIATLSILVFIVGKRRKLKYTTEGKNQKG